jgi:hypothetical protein
MVNKDALPKDKDNLFEGLDNVFDLADDEETVKKDE